MYQLMSTYPTAEAAKEAIQGAPQELRDFAIACIDALPPAASVSVHLSKIETQTLVHVHCVPAPANEDKAAD